MLPQVHRPILTSPKYSSFAELYRLACIYGFQGKSAEARDALMKAMGPDLPDRVGPTYPPG